MRVSIREQQLDSNIGAPPPRPPQLPPEGNQALRAASHLSILVLPLRSVVPSDEIGGPGSVRHEASARATPHLPHAPRVVSGGAEGLSECGRGAGLEEQEQEEELRVEGLEPPPPPPVAGVRRIHSSPAIAITSSSSVAAAGVTITIAAEAAGRAVGCREERR